MDRPDDLELFALYHLGLDREGQWRFRNSHQCAQVLGVDIETLQRWLVDRQLDSDSVKVVAYKLSIAAVDAQFVDAAEASAFTRRVWIEFQAARAVGGGGEFQFDIDYDALPSEDD